VSDQSRTSTFFGLGAAGWTAVFTAVLTVFTFLLFYVAYGADKAMKRSQRATVFVGGVSPVSTKILSKDNKTWESTRVGIQFSNGAATPPKNLRYKLNEQVLPGEIPLGYQFDDQDSSEPRRILLGPGTSWPGFMSVPLDSFIAAKEGRQRLYLWGRVTYQDVFSDDLRLTEFCFEAINVEVAIPLPDQPLDPRNGFHFEIAPCAQHNCYDDDCPDYATRAAVEPRKR
jgi:hypothetical protein